MDISHPNITLRPWRNGDEHAIPRHADNRAVWRNLRDSFPHPYTIADARAWIQRATADIPPLSFAIVADGVPVGGVGLVRGDGIHTGTARIGCWLGEPFWGRGIMTDAVLAVTRYGFDKLAVRRIHGEVFGWNDASMRVLEKAGYVREGVRRAAILKDGEITDAIIYAAIKDEWRDPTAT